ncbi:hypothetical protein EST92_05140 [Streptomyces sp. TM32]|nr:hypothetical protein EST92_05140 [Streptomyces sp. TM32]
MSLPSSAGGDRAVFQGPAAARNPDAGGPAASPDDTAPDVTAPDDTPLRTAHRLLEEAGLL